jgi:hypothetical protein
LLNIADRRRKAAEKHFGVPLPPRHSRRLAHRRESFIVVRIEVKAGMREGF